MRIVILIFVLMAVSRAYEIVSNLKSGKYNPLPEITGKSTIVEGNFLTELDHYRPQDIRTLRFTYSANLDFYIPSGPIFIFVNSPGPFTTEWLQTGLMFDIAQEVGAALITADHRYFGHNIPTPSASFGDLQYLTVEQSIADIAHLITGVLDDLDADNSTKVILWSTSYGAKLAVYARQKYPHLVDGVWSSSGFFFTDGITTEPYAQLSYIIQNYGDSGCATRIQQAFWEMELSVEQGNSDLLEETFNFCSPLDTGSDLNLANFFLIQITHIIDYLNVYHFSGLQSICSDIQSTNSTMTAMESLANWAQNVFGSELDCFDYSFQSSVDTLSLPLWNFPGTISGQRQWQYMRCTQVALFEISVGVETLFGPYVTEAFYYYRCRDVLGPAFSFGNLNENIDAIRILYGAGQPEATNVVFTNGNMDPWAAHGIRVPYHYNIYVINIPLLARSGDLHGISDLDTPELRTAKEKVRELILDWIDTDPVHT